MGEDDELSSGKVADLLGLAPATVRGIPREDLPYRTTKGGPLRAGRRWYRRADVERYLQGGDPPDVEARLAALEADVADLKAWRDRKDGER